MHLNICRYNSFTKFSNFTPHDNTFRVKLLNLQYTGRYFWNTTKNTT